MTQRKLLTAWMVGQASPVHLTPEELAAFSAALNRELQWQIERHIEDALQREFDRAIRVKDDASVKPVGPSELRGLTKDNPIGPRIRQAREFWRDPCECDDCDCDCLQDVDSLLCWSCKRGDHEPHPELSKP